MFSNCRTGKALNREAGMDGAGGQASTSLNTELVQSASSLRIPAVVRKYRLATIQGSCCCRCNLAVLRNDTNDTRRKPAIALQVPDPAIDGVAAERATQSLRFGPLRSAPYTALQEPGCPQCYSAQLRQLLSLAIVATLEDLPVRPGNAGLLSADAFPSRPAARRSPWQQFHQTDPARIQLHTFCDCVPAPFASMSVSSSLSFAGRGLEDVRRHARSLAWWRITSSAPQESPSKHTTRRQKTTKQEKSFVMARPGLQLQLAPGHLGGEVQHVLPPARAVAGKGRGTAGDAVRRLTTAGQIRQDLQDLAGSYNDGLPGQQVRDGACDHADRFSQALAAAFQEMTSGERRKM